MEKKLKIIFEVLFVIVALSFYTIKTVIPEYKNKIGSSDRIINPDKCSGIVEVQINDLDFMILTDKDNKIYHILFFEKKSLVLYNKGIENSDIDTAVTNIIKILIKTDNLKDDSNIVILKYDNSDNDIFIKNFKSNLIKYNITKPILEKEYTLREKARNLNITSTTKNDILLEMDLFSKEIYSTYTDTSIEDKNINKTNSRTYTDNVYKKIEKYISKNNISNLDKNNQEFLINLIPADSNANYYPSGNSWYYVNNKKIYAYIEIIDNNDKYAYCYKGSIDLVNEGECGNNE